MRIFHVLEAVEGGTALHVRTLAAAQRAQGHDVAVAAPEARVKGLTDRSFWNALESAGITARKLRLHQLPVHPMNASAALKLHRFLREWKPDVVHSHSTAAGALARPVAKALHMPSVHTPNGVRFADGRRTATGFGELLLERSLARITSKVVAVSESEAVALRAAYEPTKITVVPNGVEISDEPADPFPDPPRVVSVARLKYQKAPEHTVRVLAELRRRRPDVEAIMVGAGTRARTVRALRDELDPAIKLAYESLTGREAIRSATVVLLTSRWEGAPYVPMEAMERSRPVVATDVVGSRDVVLDGRTGYLVPFGDIGATASRLIDLVADPERVQTLGRTGRERLLANYTLPQMVETLNLLYDELERTG